MKPYGVKRNYNATDDYTRGGDAHSIKMHRRMVKLCHRIARRTAKLNLKNRKNLLDFFVR